MSFGDMLAKAQRDIERMGWTAVGVFPGVDDEPSPGFTYSIGLQEHDHPEVIVLGVPPLVAHSIIRGVYERVSEGETFEDGDRVSEILEGYDVLFRDVPAPGSPLNMARRYYGVEEIPALQILWPDAEGRFPGEGCEEKYERAQEFSTVVD